MVYNQALLNNLYHDIKKYKDIQVLVEGGKEAQTYIRVYHVCAWDEKKVHMKVCIALIMSIMHFMNICRWSFWMRRRTR